LQREAGKIVRLPVEHPPAPEPAPAPAPNRLHSAAVTGMAVSAFVGIFSMLALITIRWPADLSRYVTTIFVGSIVTFLLCAALAVASAARGARSATSVVPPEDEPH